MGHFSTNDGMTEPAFSEDRLQAGSTPSNLTLASEYDENNYDGLTVKAKEVSLPLFRKAPFRQLNTTIRFRFPSEDAPTLIPPNVCFHLQPRQCQCFRQCQNYNGRTLQSRQKSSEECYETRNSSSSRMVKVGLDTGANISKPETMLNWKVCKKSTISLVALRLEGKIDCGERCQRKLPDLVMEVKTYWKLVTEDIFFRIRLYPHYIHFAQG